MAIAAWSCCCCPVAHALKSGYRHIDCAFAYSNEAEVGQGLAEGFETGIKRQEVFVTTKLWGTYRRKVEENLDISLSRLGLEYVDLYLMHWPIPLNPHGNPSMIPLRPDGTRDLDTGHSFIDTYKSMEKLLKTGKAKAIGVSNCTIKYLEELLPQVSVVPAVNQVSSLLNPNPINRSSGNIFGHCHPSLPRLTL